MQLTNAQYVILGVVIVFTLARLFHRKEPLLWYVKSLAMMYAALFATLFVVIQLQRPEVEKILWAVLSLFVTDKFFVQGRGRVIRKADRRKAIERWGRKTGQKFNRAIHELDHVIPFAKGGDNAGYNLRVTTKKENRSKGKRSPRWDLIGRWRD